jgi:protein TonB
MDASTWRSHPRQQWVGLALVVLLHAGIIHALATGMATKIVNAIHSPIETKVIAEPKPPPPPVDIAVPPPEFKAPAPPFVPPPEVHIVAPPPVQNTITAVTQTPPPAPVVIAPLPPPVEAPPAVAPPPASPAPIAKAIAPVSAAVVCSNHATVMGDAAYPREAQRAGISAGDALIQFTVGPTGQLKDIKVIHASHPIFARNSVRIVAEYRCQGQGHDVLVEVPMGYRLE